MANPARTPEPPYFAVIFTSTKAPEDPDYGPTSARMVELAEQQDGYLGYETARGPDGLGITVSYWRDEASIKKWKADAEHAVAQARGRGEWYEQYVSRVAKVERVSDFP